MSKLLFFAAFLASATFLLWFSARRPVLGMALALAIALASTFLSTIPAAAPLALGVLILLTWGVLRLGGAEPPAAYRGALAAVLLLVLAPVALLLLGKASETIALRNR